MIRPVPSRSRGAGRTRGTTNGRYGFDPHPDPDAARLAVAIPAAAVNNLPVFDVLNISGLYVLHFKRLAKSAAKMFDPLVTFCVQARVDIDVAVRHLERFEQRLGVCVRSWGACCLLFKVAKQRGLPQGARKEGAGRTGGGRGSDGGWGDAPVADTAAATVQRAQNRRQKHVCSCLFLASRKPVFLFDETEFLCKTQIDPP